jgi:hypothetical protein
MLPRYSWSPVALFCGYRLDNQALPLTGVDRLAEDMAIAISFLTDDFSRTLGSVSTMWRTLAPVPLSNPSGSGNFAPCKKKRLTQRGYTAIENIASDVLSPGPNPIASAL